MKSVFLQIGIVLFQLQTIWSVFAVLSGDVARHSWNTAGFLLCALKYHLYACLPLFTPFVLEIALLRSLFQRVIQTNLVNSSQTSCTNVQLDPCILFYPVELTTEEVHIKAALGVAL